MLRNDMSDIVYYADKSVSEFVIRLMQIYCQGIQVVSFMSHVDTGATDEYHDSLQLIKKIPPSLFWNLRDAVDAKTIIPLCDGKLKIRLTLVKEQDGDGDRQKIINGIAQVSATIEFAIQWSADTVNAAVCELSGRKTAY
jgi:hypothetical protein